MSITLQDLHQVQLISLSAFFVVKNCVMFDLVAYFFE